MIWGAPYFCPKNDLMDLILPEKPIGFLGYINVISKKKVFTEIETVFQSKVRRSPKKRSVGFQKKEREGKRGFAWACWKF